MTRKSRVLIDHDEIRNWAEERDAQPSCVRGTGSEEDIGVIRLDFPGYSGETSLEPIEWDAWFQMFDENNLALLVEDETAGSEQSNFNKIIGREIAEAGASGRKTSRRTVQARGKTGGETRRRRSATSARASSRRGNRSRSGTRKGAASRSRSRSGRSTSARGKSSRNRTSRSRSAPAARGKKRAQGTRANSRSRSRRRAA